jgi:hypothetical protein
MMLFPAMMIGGHLAIAVVDKAPTLNFEPICREAAGESLGVKDNLEFCRNDEIAAREQLAKQWGEFDSGDRTRCVRTSTYQRSASYVEVLTCLEMSRDARKLRRPTDTLISEPVQAPERERISPPVRNARAPQHPDPVSLVPPESQPRSPSGFFQVFCLPGLAALIPACDGANR